MLDPHFSVTVVPRVGHVIHEAKGTGCNMKFLSNSLISGRKIRLTGDAFFT